MKEIVYLKDLETEAEVPLSDYSTAFIAKPTILGKQRGVDWSIIFTFYNCTFIIAYNIEF